MLVILVLGLLVRLQLRSIEDEANKGILKTHSKFLCIVFSILITNQVLDIVCDRYIENPLISLQAPHFFAIMSFFIILPKFLYVNNCPNLKTYFNYCPTPIFVWQVPPGVKSENVVVFGSEE